MVKMVKMENMYKKITVSMLDEVLLQMEKNSKDESKFVLQYFGTVEQIKKIQKEYDESFTKYLNEWIDKH